MIEQRPATARSRRGRPPAPLQPSASAAAQLGAELRAHRQANDLTLSALAARVGYSAQHISEVEHGRATVNDTFLKVCDIELAADGALMRLLPAVILEHARQRSARVAARRGANSNGDLEDGMDPTNRRDLAQAGATAALNLALPAPPGRAGEVDPALAQHWERLLAIIGSHDAAHGPQDVLATARSEMHIISAHRAIASGEQRTALMRVEARWAIHVAWLCEDTGDRRGRAALLERALHLAREADHPDLIAWARARQAQWSDPPRAMRLAEAALRTPRASAHTRALCALRAAHAHAHLTDSQSTERMLAQALHLAAEESPAPPLSISFPLGEHVVRCWEARCWAALSPVKAIALYDGVLRDWPRGRTRDGGVYLARLAVACANAGELDRARAEGRKALAIARVTKSSVANRELTHLTTTLST